MNQVKKGFKFALKVLGGIILIPIVYILISLILTYIPVAEKTQDQPKNQTIYLTTNGMHMDVVLPRQLMTAALLKDLKQTPDEQYFAFGWGEENFYLNTPTWGDLSFKAAFKAAFLRNNTLVHLTKYSQKREKWIPIAVSANQLKELNEAILESFQLNVAGEKLILKGASYGTRDNFYKANGRYSYKHTCNTWGNTILKKSGMKAALWTPFDFGVLRRYE